MTSSGETTATTGRPFVRFRIAWSDIRNGGTGHGLFVFRSRLDAEETAVDLNREFRGRVHHWVEERVFSDEAPASGGQEG